MTSSDNTVIGGDDGGKKLYLVTDEGFSTKFALNLTVMLAIVYLGGSIPEVWDLAAGIYYNINHWMLTTAHQYAWWSLLGLLSSSCCALQLILNAMSFGCAGFNTVLGPLRPTFLAFAVILQSFSWYVAWSRPWQWAPTATSTILAVITSFLPEFLALRVTKPKSLASNSKGANSSCSRTLRFSMNSVGCAACLTTVAGVLKTIKGIHYYETNMETGIMTVNCGLDCDENAILERLDDAGFPMTINK